MLVFTPNKAFLKIEQQGPVYYEKHAGTRYHKQYEEDNSRRTIGKHGGLQVAGQ